MNLRKRFCLGDTIFGEFSNMKGFIININKQTYLDIEISFSNCRKTYYTNSMFFSESRIILIEKKYKNEL